MMRGEFLFNGRQMRRHYGIAVERSRDTLLPQLRERKSAIPGVDGLYDYGARNYEERLLTLDCNMAGPVSRAQLREIAYLLSQKGRIEVWDEADKYYVGRIYDAAELEKIGRSSERFSLTFVCEPFAYGPTMVKPIQDGLNRLTYEGSAATPTLIVIRNTGSESVQAISVTATFRK